MILNVKINKIIRYNISFSLTIDKFYPTKTVRILHSFQEILNCLIYINLQTNLKCLPESDFDHHL